MATTALTLYEAEDNLLALMNTLPMVEDGGDETQLLAILDDIATASQAAVAKRDGYIRFIRHLDTLIDQIPEEVKRLRAHGEMLEKHRDRVKHHVARVMAETIPEPPKGRGRSLQGTLGTLGFRRGMAGVEVTNLEALPLHLRRATVTMLASDWAFIVNELWPKQSNPGPLALTKVQEEPSKSLIKEAIESGQSVPGADIKFGPDTVIIR